MLVGHFAVGFLAKRLEPAISLGTAVLAAMLADVLVFPLLLAGVERFHAATGVSQNRMLGEIPFSHGLLLDCVWGAVFAGGWFLFRRSRRGALLLFAVVVSHWLLDFVSHRPDMTLVPGGAVYGLGLWNSVPAALAVEGGLWLAAVIFYVHATRARHWLGVVVFWLGVLLLTLAWHDNIVRGMDPDPAKAAAGGLIFFPLMLAWAYWMNRLRPART